MPFSVKRYGTRKKMEKMKRCVSKVSASGSKVNPYAVCRASIYPKKISKKAVKFLRARSITQNEKRRTDFGQFDYPMKVGWGYGR